ncbi:PAP-associated domain-containing protein 5-like [Planoprotostelium fungivorum]|uniref:PAP-associated domain-containing protein 5-like n=1 Tax=Planoprotostelium fungivorum TaxID=1890364 RepID=A0A2P6NRY7_9EUKA|nr:PAP-associated domain-containing protein 5-like [Planoprotostelium fungivorum]
MSTEEYHRSNGSYSSFTPQETSGLDDPPSDINMRRNSSDKNEALRKSRSNGGRNIKRDRQPRPILRRVSSEGHFENINMPHPARKGLLWRSDEPPKKDVTFQSSSNGPLNSFTLPDWLTKECRNSNIQNGLHKKCKEGAQLAQWFLSLSPEERGRSLSFQDPETVKMIMQMHKKRCEGEGLFFAAGDSFIQVAFEKSKREVAANQFCFRKLSNLNHCTYPERLILFDNFLADSIRLGDTRQYLDTMTIASSLLEDGEAFIRVMHVVTRGNFLKDPCKVNWQDRQWIWDVPKWFSGMGFYSLGTFIAHKLETVLWLKYWEAHNLDPRSKPSYPKYVRSRNLEGLLSKSNLIHFWKSLQPYERRNIVGSMGNIVYHVLSNPETNRTGSPPHSMDLDYPKMLSELVDLSSQESPEQNERAFIEVLYFSPLDRADMPMDLVLRRVGFSIQSAYIDKLQMDIIVGEEAAKINKENGSNKKKKTKKKKVKKRENTKKKEEERTLVEEIVSVVEEPPVKEVPPVVPTPAPPVVPWEDPTDDQGDFEEFGSNKKKKTRKQNKKKSNSRRSTDDIELSNNNKKEEEAMGQTSVSAPSSPVARRRAAMSVKSQGPQAQIPVQSAPVTPPPAQVAPVQAHSQIPVRVNNVGKIQPWGIPSKASSMPSSTTSQMTQGVARSTSQPVMSDQAKSCRLRTSSDGREKPCTNDSENRPRSISNNSGKSTTTRANSTSSLPTRSHAFSAPSLPSQPHSQNPVTPTIPHPPSHSHSHPPAQSHTPPTEEPKREEKKESTALDKEIRDFYCRTRQIIEGGYLPKVHDIIRRITLMVKRLWDGAYVETYGSYATFLCIPASDIDLVVFGADTSSAFRSIGNYTPRNSIQLLAKQLTQSEWVTSIQVIETAKVPVIKLLVDKEGISISADVSFNQEVEGAPVYCSSEGLFSHCGIAARELIKGHIRKMPEMVQLVLVLKQFLQEKSLNNAFMGGLSSYCLVIMTISFLQMRSLNKEPPPLNVRMDLGDLFLEFLEMYGKKFDYEKMGITIQNGGGHFSLDKSIHANTGASLVIVDPFNPTNNLGQHTKGIWSVKAAFSKAHDELYNSEKSGAFLHRILRHHPEAHKSLSHGSHRTANLMYDALTLEQTDRHEDVSQLHLPQPKTQSHLRRGHHGRKTLRHSSSGEPHAPLSKSHQVFAHHHMDYPQQPHAHERRHNR